MSSRRPTALFWALCVVGFLQSFCEPLRDPQNCFQHIPWRPRKWIVSGGGRKCTLAELVIAADGRVHRAHRSAWPLVTQTIHKVARFSAEESLALRECTATAETSFFFLPLLSVVRDGRSYLKS